MTTETTNPTPAAATETEKPKPAVQEDEDYNLNEEIKYQVKRPSSYQQQPRQRYQQQQSSGYQRRNTKGEFDEFERNYQPQNQKLSQGLFKSHLNDEQEDDTSRIPQFFEELDERTPEQIEAMCTEDLKNFDQQLKEFKESEKELLDLIKNSESRKLQRELMDLIKSKVDTGDQTKAKLFTSKLRSLSKKANLNIDEVTMTQIEALFIQRQNLSEEDIYHESFKHDFLQGLQVEESLHQAEHKGPTSNESFRQEKVEYRDYESYLADYAIHMSNQVNAYPVLTPGEIIDKELESIPPQQQQQEDEMDFGKDGIDQEIQQQLEKMKSFAIDKVPQPFDIPRLADSVPSFKELNERIETVLEGNRVERYRLLNDERSGFDYEEALNEAQASGFNHREEGAEIFAQLNELEEHVETLMKDDLKSQFLLAKNYIKQNQLLRTKVVNLTKQARQSLNVTMRNKDKLVNRLEITAKEQATDVIPNKIYDFIKFEKTNAQRQSELRALMHDRQTRKDSKKINDFNTDMQIFVRIYQLQRNNVRERTETLNKMFQVFKLMEQNKAKPDVNFQARLFEYAVYTKNKDLANRKLNEILKNQSKEYYGQINTDVLKTFFKQCLKQDNFAGLGNMMSYIEQRNISLASWPLEQFKSSLDFYLNHSLNLNNLMTFTRYYTQIQQNRLEALLEKEYNGKTIDQLNDGEKYALNRALFSGVESLVDMKMLFQFLVQQVGNRNAVDPVSKKDLMWNIIDFFTQDGMIELQKLSPSPLQTIEEADIALFIKNHLEESQAFDRATKLILRYNDSKDSNLQNALLQNFREYQTNKNGELPFSFEKNKIRTSYIKLKTAGEQHKTKFSEKTLEYYLYLFKSLKMWPEIIDLSENFNKLTQTNDESEIKKHYLSDALLRIDSNQHYHKLVQAAVYGGQDENSPGYITSMTKAYFKDGSIQHGVSFFQSKINQIQQIRQKREDYLVDLFDSVFDEEANKALTYEEFREKYHRAIRLSERTLRESFSISQLARILEEKDYDYIDALFQYYLVDIEETNFFKKILLKRNDLTLLQLQGMTSQDLANKEVMNAEEAERLQMTQERKLALQSLLRQKDIRDLMAMKEVMGENAVAIFNNELDNKTADELTQIFQIQSIDQIEDILERTEPIYNRAYKDIDDASMVNNDIRQDVANYQMTEILSQEMETEIYDKRSIRLMADLHAKRKRKLHPERERQIRQDLSLIHQFIFEGDIADPQDPIARTIDAYNQSIINYKQDLLEAVNSRKEDVLDIALKIFNKLQEQHFKTVKLSDLEKMNPKEVIEQKKVNEALDKISMLLTDPTSPLFTVLKTTGLLQDDNQSFNDAIEELGQDLDQINFDLQGQQKQKEQLVAISEVLEKQVENLKELSQYILNKANQEDSYSKAYENEYKRLKENDAQNLDKSLEARVQQHYQQYLNSFEQNKRAIVAQDLNRDQKLNILSDIFTIEYQNQFIDNLFPAFYSQDLIIFGLENKIPEAIRLGEQMMSQNGQVLPRDIQVAVKEYLFINNDKYQAAVKNTGPIDNQSLYRSHKNQKERPVFIQKDDPYWQEYLKNTWKRSELWKAPSYFAFMHKKNGILGEVMNLPTEQQLEKNLRHAAML